MTASAGTTIWRDLIHKPFFWGIVAILALLALNVIKDPTYLCLLYTSPSPRDVEESRMPSSA